MLGAVESHPSVLEQPLAATVWDDLPLADSEPANDDTPQYDTLLATAFAHLRRRYQNRRSDESIAMEAKLAGNTRSPVRLQIAVTIAMPSQDFPRTESDEPLEYSIGLYNMPWKKTD